jgi:uncharacterized protein (TIGR02271 family)
MRTVVGLYNRFEDARQAVQALRDANINKDDINLIAQDPNGEYKRYMDLNKEGQTQDVSDGATAGAGIGAVLGGLGGLLVGLGALAIPGVGPIIAAGPIVSALAGAGAGAVAGGIVGALVDLGVPEEHAKAYAEGIRRGGTLVTVRTPDDRSDQVMQIMEQFNPVDIKGQMKNWQGTGEATQMRDTEEQRMERDTIPVTGSEQGVDIPVVEEELNVGKQTMDTGGVRVEKNIKEEPVEKNIDLRHEHVNVERRPVNREATDEDLNAFQEGSMEFDETDERAVAEKRARVVEEVHVDKDVDIENRTVRDTLRKDEVNVEQRGSEDFSRFEQTYRDHFYNTFANRAGLQESNFNDYLPAYRYGHTLSNDNRFAKADWMGIEPQARMDWERRYGEGTWEKVKDAVRYAWERSH